MITQYLLERHKEYLNIKTEILSLIALMCIMLNRIKNRKQLAIIVILSGYY